ncbi:metallophosphoesterase [Puniceicoccaceae bacterium K14]|nr:metallophosphoesterase [Puniceicoccaceae bacterium K14]
MIEDLTIFHFTDLHCDPPKPVRSKGPKPISQTRVEKERLEYNDEILGRAQKAVEKYKLHNPKGKHVLLFGGDYFHRGNANEITTIRDNLILPLIDNRSETSSKKLLNPPEWKWDGIGAVPGNHDIPFLSEDKVVDNNYDLFTSLFSEVDEDIVEPISGESFLSLGDDKIKIWLANSSDVTGCSDDSYHNGALAQRVEKYLREHKDLSTRERNVITQFYAYILETPFDRFVVDQSPYKKRAIERLKDYISKNHTLSPAYVDRSKMKIGLSDNDLLRIALMHHPSLPYGPDNDQFHLNAFPTNKALVDNNFSLVLHGHVHQNFRAFYGHPPSIRDAKKSRLLKGYVESGFLNVGCKGFGKYQGDGFNVIEIKPNKRTGKDASICVFNYTFDGTGYTCPDRPLECPLMLRERFY